MRWFQRILIGVAILCTLASIGCRQTPSEVYIEARTAAETEDLEAFLPHFTRWSRSVLRGFSDVVDQSRRRLQYVRTPMMIHTFGDVANETITDDLAVLEVTGSRGSEKVVLVVEDGAWRIDAFRLAGFWEPIQ
jgi:hypothetical protein